MEFGKHLGKGLWGVADKALPVAYGLAFVLLVIRVLPERDFGNFVLVQEVFLVISTLIASFALQPMTKFLAEGADGEPQIIGIGVGLSAGITLISSIAVLLAADPLGGILNAPDLAPLMRSVPLMLLASFPRNLALAALQARFRVESQFWVDAAHFLGAPLFIWILSRMNRFNSAWDLIIITIASLSLSSGVGIWAIRSQMRFPFRLSMDHLRRMWEYGSYSLGGTASYLIYSRADTFILSAATGPLHVALYSSAKIFTRVFDMVTQIVQMFVLPAASRLGSQGERGSLKAVVEKAILFLTVGLLPVLVLFLFLPDLLLEVVYGGRYVDAAPLLRIFALLTGAVPLLAVGMNLLLGLGRARDSFILGIQMLIVSIGCYLLFIPWWGEVGAAIAVVVSTYLLAIFSARQIRKQTGTSFVEVISRSGDIVAFVRARLHLNSR